MKDAERYKNSNEIERRINPLVDDYLSDDAYFYGSLYIIPERSLGYREQRDVADEAINKIMGIVKKLRANFP